MTDCEWPVLPIIQDHCNECDVQCIIPTILLVLNTALITHQTGRDINGKRYDYWTIRAEREETA